MRHLLTHALVLLPLAMASAAASGTDLPCSERPREPVPETIMGATFFNAHPDLQWRAEGLRAWRQGNHAKAMRDFLSAARHADKLSQAMVGQMHWEGLGTPVDRALGYAWMDLAAERGYHNFVQLRELYWSALTADEQADAIARGQAVWADHRDRVAKPRVERAMKQALRNITGSRTGFTSAGLTVSVRTASGEVVTVPAPEYYSPKYYDPEQYWCTQDAYWSRPLNPEVAVGELTPVTELPQENP